MTTTMDKLKEVFIPSLITGASAAGILFFMDSRSARAPIEFLGMSMPGYAMIGSSAFIGNMAGEVLTTVVLPYAEHGMSKEIMKTEDLVIPPALSGLSTYGAVRLFAGLKDVPLLNVGLLGAGASVAGNYIYDKYASKNY